MFPISLTTLISEETYQRFFWAVLLRRKSFLFCIVLMIGFLLFYPLTRTAEELRFYPFAMFFTALILFPIFYFVMSFLIKRAYRKIPYWQDVELTLIFEENQFIVKSVRGEVVYQYSEIAKVFDTKSDIFIMLGPNVGIPIEKKDCSLEILEFLLTLTNQRL